MKSKTYTTITVATIIAGALLPMAGALAQDDTGGAPPVSAVAASPLISSSSPCASQWVQRITNAPGMHQYRWWDLKLA